eukprot:GHVQ01042265.1.p1 GENE.GHVQ01042265.1~~GHVQ01042265.1.p1  ORF type:complete len:360 (+),score=57.16 GHVQ01042265.1:166-1245(+)
MYDLLSWISMQYSSSTAPAPLPFPLNILHAGAVVVGVVTLWRMVFSKWAEMLIGFSTPNVDLNKLGEWGVVTGGTDGIGKAMCIELAKSGMSVCVVGRDQDKLNAVEKEIKDTIKDFRGSTKTVCIDFSEPGEEIYTRLEEVLHGLDIGVLVNNVGISYPRAMYFYEVPTALIDDLISVNVRSVLRTTRIVFKQMCENRRGGIICVGSGAAALPSDPLYAGYVATKAAVSGFCETLQVECASSNVMVQCHVPLLVTSKLSKCRTPSFTTPSAQHYARLAIRCLIRGSASKQGGATQSPYWVHRWILRATNFLPAAVWNTYRLHMCLALRERGIKKASLGEEGRGERESVRGEEGAKKVE